MKYCGKRAYIACLCTILDPDNQYTCLSWALVSIQVIFLLMNILISRIHIFRSTCLEVEANFDRIVFESEGDPFFLMKYTMGTASAILMGRPLM